MPTTTNTTGPRTKTGRRRSSQNATRHGLYAQKPKLSGPERARLSRRIRRWTADLNPSSPAQRLLLSQAAYASILLDRFARLESEAWTQAILADPANPTATPHLSLLRALTRSTTRWELALLRSLKVLRSSRAQNELGAILGSIASQACVYGETSAAGSARANPTEPSFIQGQPTP